MAYFSYNQRGHNEFLTISADACEDLAASPIKANPIPLSFVLSGMDGVRLNSANFTIPPSNGDQLVLQSFDKTTRKNQARLRSYASVRR